MDDIHIVVGGQGVVGNQVVKKLKERKRYVLVKSTKEIIDCPKNELATSICSLFAKHLDNIGKPARVSLILAHRCRDEDIQIALSNELQITRNFVWALSSQCISLNVVVIGSITGRLVSKKLPESYHYAKDLQKSIVRQSVRVSNLYMNLLELNWFRKYGFDKATSEYNQIMSDLTQELEGDHLPSVETITDFCCSLIDMQLPPRGQTIIYDGGLSLFQID